MRKACTSGLFIILLLGVVVVTQAFAQAASQPATQTPPAGDQQCVPAQAPANQVPAGQTPVGQAPGTQAGTVEGEGRPAPCIPLATAIEMALQNNPQITTALEQIERARGQVEEAEARGRINFNANAAYTVQGPQQTISIPTSPDQPPQTVSIVQTSNTRAQVSAVQPLDISGRIRLAESIAGLNERIQIFGLETTTSDLALDVRTAYYTVLRAYGQRDTAQAAVNVAQEQLRIATDLYEAGTTARFDVVQAEVRVANLQQDLITAQSNVRLAKAVLNTQLGREANLPIEVQEQVVTVDARTLNADALVPVAYQNRPEVKAAETGVTLSEQNVRFVRKQLAPSAALSGNVNWTQEASGFANNNVTWDATAAISVPIFDGGVTRAQVRQARADEGISRAQLAQARLNVSQEVQNAVTTLRNATERISTASANVRLAEEALQLARVRFESQVGTSVEVSEAESNLTEANSNLVDARYDYLIAIARLQRALGTETVTSPAAPASAPAGS